MLTRFKGIASLFANTQPDSYPHPLFLLSHNKFTQDLPNRLTRRPTYGKKTKPVRKQLDHHDSGDSFKAHVSHQISGVVSNYRELLFSPEQ